MKSNPLVSVIVTSYKRPDFLLKTLRSILSQTYTNLEVFVVDDGSNDATEEVVKSLNDERIQFFSISHSGRPAVPRNFGLQHACGDFIAFCDDDDLWQPLKIAEQVSVFTENPFVKLCYTDCALINENDQPIPNAEKNKKKIVTDFQSQLRKNSVTFSTAIIHKDIILSGLKFNEKTSLKATEDYLFFTQIIHDFSIYFLPKKLVKYRIHQNGISYSRESVKKLVQYYLRVVRAHYCFIKLVKYSYSDFLFFIGYHFIDILKQITFIYYNKLKDWKKNV